MLYLDKSKCTNGNRIPFTPMVVDFMEIFIEASIIGSQPRLEGLGPKFVIGGFNIASICITQEILFTKSGTFGVKGYFVAYGTLSVACVLI